MEDRDMLLTELADNNVDALKSGFLEAMRLLESSDYSTGIEKMQALADDGNVKAIKQMAAIYQEGSLVPVDRKKAAQWIWEAASKGDAESQRQLGLLYKKGDVVALNFQEAFRWLKLAANQGDSEAQAEYAYALYNNYHKEYGEEVYEEALEMAMKASEKSEPTALFVLGELYRCGHAVTCNIEKALKWYKKAADIGNAEAMFWLGNCYSWVNDAPKDEQEALYWYTRSAELDFEMAAHKLSSMYLSGDGAPQNIQEGIKWLKKAAELGDPLAKADLGEMYLEGKVLPFDEAQAVYWLEKVGSNNQMSSAYKLLEQYYSEFGTEHFDAEKTFYYLRKSAILKDESAQALLGYFYFSGTIGNVPNYAEAKKWLYGPANQGMEYAELYMSRILKSEAGSDFNKQQEAFNMLVHATNREEPFYDAKIVLSEWYENGVAGHRDIVTARRLLEECIGEEDFAQSTEDSLIANAARRYGKMLYDGLGGPRDSQEGIEFLKIAANDCEDGEAMYELGVIYRDGKYVKKDKKLSEQAFAIASQRGFYGR